MIRAFIPDTVLLINTRGSKFILFGSDMQLMVTVLFFITDSDIFMNPPLSMTEVGKGHKVALKFDK